MGRPATHSLLSHKMSLLGLKMLVLAMATASARGAAITQCCTNKTVEGVEYNLVEEMDTEGFGCKSDCVFEKVGSPGSRFCFKEGELEVVCDNNENEAEALVATCQPDPNNSNAIAEFVDNHVCLFCYNAQDAADFSASRRNPKNPNTVFSWPFQIYPYPYPMQLQGILCYGLDAVLTWQCTYNNGWTCTPYQTLCKPVVGSTGDPNQPGHLYRVTCLPPGKK